MFSVESYMYTPRYRMHYIRFFRVTLSIYHTIPYAFHTIFSLLSVGGHAPWGHAVSGVARAPVTLKAPPSVALGMCDLRGFSRQIAMCLQGVWTIHCIHTRLLEGSAALHYDSAWYRLLCRRELDLCIYFLFVLVSLGSLLSEKAYERSIWKLMLYLVSEKIIINFIYLFPWFSSGGNDYERSRWSSGCRLSDGKHNNIYI